MTSLLRRLILATLLSLVAVGSAAADALWDSRPYEVMIELDASRTTLPARQRERLLGEVVERVHTRLPGFWRIRSREAADLAADGEPVDKQFAVMVTATGAGYEIKVTETDVLLSDVGSVKVARAASAADLPERLFDAIQAGFRPVATLVRDPASPRRVTLAYRAAAAAPGTTIATAKPGSVLLPYRRRLDREGQVSEVGPNPWTYLVADPEEADSAPSATVFSHTRRPFSGRSGGRVELFAIAAPVDPAQRTWLRLHAFDDESVGLPGYEVLLGRLGEETLQPIGYTDDDGRVRLPAESGVWMANVRCGTIAVASIPVAPGVTPLIDVPLVDERSRLRAELEVTSLREELVDTVARRKILAERIRRLADDQQFDAAKRLLDEFESLPGQSDFKRRLDSAQRSAKADHPLAKARLDRLFEKTFVVVNSALDARESRELAVSIDKARQDAAARDGEDSTPQAAQGG
ncbi:hypothetical protein Pla108_22170 [Botrimarina colliarenosi]|uniref:Uncharacterized protein n=1 Tax=Botrimarina colliarenosi TaxID=2528001 RepID=A0A5C6ADC7_9BACT|nr:hypothetical protein [Botrimarina colliarenosi]TWT98062.1 hypothetical protein Pla108_22170 [Botrimarina colliarenosi]